MLSDTGVSGGHGHTILQLRNDGSVGILTVYPTFSDKAMKTDPPM